MKKVYFVMFLAVVFSATVFSGDFEKGAVIKVDLGVVVETGVVTPVDGISTAGQPNADALKVFAENGYKTVIDLRTEAEDRGMDEASVVEELNMEYIVLPIAGGGAINFENARALDELIAGAEGPVLLHCGSANRVGALLALGKRLDGVDVETALEYGREAGITSIELEGLLRSVMEAE